MLQFVLDTISSRGGNHLSAGMMDRLVSGIGSATPEVGACLQRVGGAALLLDATHPSTLTVVPTHPHHRHRHQHHQQQPQMADLSVQLAVAHGRQLTLLRHALGSPPLARLLLSRLAAAAPALLAPAARIAGEISRVLVGNADSEGAMESASLLFGLTEGDADLRGELERLLAARRPESLLEWHWLHRALGERAQPLRVSGGYWGVLQVWCFHGRWGGQCFQLLLQVLGRDMLLA